MSLVSYLLITITFALNHTQEQQCDYARSNLEYISSQTILAIKAEKVEISKYYAYRALNAFEKSKEQLKACACEYTNDFLMDGAEDIKKATRVVSLNGTRIFLKRALENIEESIETLVEHKQHAHSKYGNSLLAINTLAESKKKKHATLPSKRDIEKKIDNSLKKFQLSLAKVIDEIDCEESYEFTRNIYEFSEKELLKNGISETKKYYHLRTKQIAAEALKKLDTCLKSSI